MTKKRNILVLLALSIAVLFADAQDFERLSERTIMGTARYVGMGGAMTAIGGDPSSVKDNPAGLGLYRRSEVMFTIDCTVDNVEQAENGVPATPYKRDIVLRLYARQRCGEQQYHVLLQPTDDLQSYHPC